MTASSDSFRRETLVAIDAVERALKLTHAGVGAAEITKKGARDVVTGTDVAAEDALRSSLSEALTSSVVGEERGGEPMPDGSPYWLIDPICGTRNFASGIPLYCVNLALVENGRVAAAVIGDPSRAEISVAELGHGAWVLKDGARRPLAASDESQTVVIEDSHAEGQRREQAARFTAAAIRAARWDLRALSTTLSLTYVAAGRVSAYVLFWTSAVHAAAGSLLAEEAGATVSDLGGRSWTIEADSIVASANPGLHDELLTLAADAASGVLGRDLTDR